MTAVFETRRERAREYIQSRGADAMLVSSFENRYYFSGFTGSAGALLITKSSASLFVDSRYVLQAAQQAQGCEIVPTAKGVYLCLNEVARREQIQSVLYEDKRFTVFEFEALKRNFDPQDYIPMGDMAAGLRRVKDESEIARIRTAAEIADAAFRHVTGRLRPGMTELEAAFEIDMFIRKQGAEKTSFDSIVASGKRGAMPHAAPSEKELAAGDMVVLDFGAFYDGYCSDMTRTVAIGSAGEREREIYKIVLYSQIKAINAVRAGVKAKEIDELARGSIAAFGYGDNFGHGLGHGVGIEIHEEPSLNAKSLDVLEKNMVVTVEPGIYVEDLCGVRIEDLLVVEEAGSEVLSKSPKELLVI